MNKIGVILIKSLFNLKGSVFMILRRSSRKGFIITVDSFLGLTLMAVFMMLSLVYLSLVSLDSWNSIDLKDSCSDLVSILEKEGVIDRALLSSSSEEASFFINSTPQSSCFELVVFDSLGDSVIHAIKTGCVKNSSSVFSVERSIVLNDEEINFFIVRVNGWFK